MQVGEGETLVQTFWSSRVDFVDAKRDSPLGRSDRRKAALNWQLREKRRKWRRIVLIS